MSDGFEGGDTTSQDKALVEERERRKRAEARLAVTERLASVGNLAAGVAHEINNPLTWLVSNLREIESGLAEDPPDVRLLLRWVKEANEGVDRIRSIVEGLRTFIHGADDQRSPMQVETALDLALKVAAGELRGRVKVEKRYGDTPDVLANAGRLSQVFLNLIVNAAQAFEDGDDRRNHLVLTTSSDGYDVLVDVTDNGPGIPREYVSRLFDPFFTTKPVGVGSGLGLSICVNIIRSLDGTLDIDTEVGRGTSFRIRLPQAPAARFSDPESMSVPEEDLRAAERATPRRVKRLRRPRVLLVDDEPRVLEALARVLRRSFEVVPCRSGREAMGIVRAGLRLDAVVSDLRMADGSGIELHKQLEDHAPHLASRCLFITGGGFAPGEQEFLDAPERRWMSKPLEPRKLEETLWEVLETSDQDPI